MSCADLQVVTPQDLLHFGALLGESSAELALGQMQGGAGGGASAAAPNGDAARGGGAAAAAAAGAAGGLPGGMLGATDSPDQWGKGWEPVAEEVCGRRGLVYRAWRRYLRKGLFAYMSRTGACVSMCVCVCVNGWVVGL